MTDPAAPADDDTLRFSQVLRSLGEGEEARLSVNDIVRAFGERAFGALMLCVGLINLIPWPPGGTTITGAPLLFITAQLAIGHERLWLPRRLLTASFDRSNFRSGLKRVLPALEKVERITKPRFRWAVGGIGERLIGLVCLLLTCILVLPIPGGNLLPALIIVVFAVGLVQRDGIVVLLGWLGVGLFVGAAIWLGGEVWDLIQANWFRIQGLFS